MYAAHVTPEASYGRLNPKMKLVWILALSLLIVPRAGAADAPSEPNEGTIETQIQELEVQISSINTLLSTFQEQLRAAYEACPSIEPIDSQADRDALLEEGKQLGSKVSALEEDIQKKMDLLERMTRENAPGQAESAEALAQRIQERKAELQTLQEKRDQFKNRGNPSFKPVPSALKCQTLILHENQIVPHADEYTKVEGFLIGRSRYFTLSKRRAGQTLAQGLGPEGCLTQLMSEQGPKQAYFKIFVCPDSIGLFEPLLEKIKAKDYWCSWDTLPGLPYSAPVSNGTGGGPEPGW